MVCAPRGKASAIQDTADHDRGRLERRAARLDRHVEEKAMDNFRLFQSVVRFVVAAVTLAAAASVQAEVSPKFFLDVFVDGNIQDDMPVSWIVTYPPNPSDTLADASSGDLVVTPHEAIFVGVDNHTYDNVSLRTQVAVPPDKEWFAATVFARGNPVDGTYYQAGITSSTHDYPNSLWIHGNFPGYEQLYHEATDLNPAETDVLLQFDLLGDQLILTAWAAGTPKESGQRVLVRDSRLTQGLIGVAYQDTCCLVDPEDWPLTPAVYRFFEAAAILPGDFNVNEVLDVEDIDLLTDELILPVPRYRPQFDLNDDKIVDLADHEIWVHDLKNTWFGDGDLNGEFNTGDLVQVLTAGRYETRRSAGWAEGDWNGDGVFGTGDLVKALEDGGYEMGPRADAAAVPEPSSAALLIFAALMPFCRRREAVTLLARF